MLIRKGKLDQKLLIVFLLDILCIILLIDSWLLIQKCMKFLMILLWNLDIPLFKNVFPLKNKLSKYVCDTSCSNLSSCSNANKDIVFEPRRSKRSKRLMILVLNFTLST